MQKFATHHSHITHVSAVYCFITNTIKTLSELKWRVPQLYTVSAKCYHVMLRTVQRHLVMKFWLYGPCTIPKRCHATIVHCAASLYLPGTNPLMVHKMVPLLIARPLVQCFDEHLWQSRSYCRSMDHTLCASSSRSFCNGTSIMQKTLRCPGLTQKAEMSYTLSERKCFVQA